MNTLGENYTFQVSRNQGNLYYFRLFHQISVSSWLNIMFLVWKEESMTFFEYHDIIVNKYISIHAGDLWDGNKYENI